MLTVQAKHDLRQQQQQQYQQQQQQQPPRSNTKYQNMLVYKNTPVKTINKHCLSICAAICFHHYMNLPCPRIQSTIIVSFSLARLISPFRSFCMRCFCFISLRCLTQCYFYIWFLLAVFGFCDCRCLFVVCARIVCSL